MARIEPSQSTKSMPSTRILVALLVLGLAAIPTEAQQPEYVGSETCQACHEDIHAALERSSCGRGRG